MTALVPPAAARPTESRSIWGDRRRPTSPVSAAPSDIPTPAPALALPGEETAIPASAGQVMEKYWPSLPVSPDSPLVIHVQDAHGRLDAQESLAKIVAAVAAGRPDKTRPLLVAVEGAWGPVDTRWLNDYPEKADRDHLAGVLLRADLLTGEEYLAVTDDTRSTEIVGVDDPALHADNESARADSAQERGAALEDLEELARRAEALKPALYSPAMRRWDDLRRRHAENTLPLADYLAALRGLAGPSFSAARYPQISTFLSLAALERTFDRPGMEAETRDLSAALEKSAGADALATLARDSLAVRQGKADPAAFYGRLKALAEKNGLRVPRLTAYTAYLKAQAGLRIESLSEESDRLAQAVPAALCQGDRRAADLWQADEALSALRSLYALELTPAGWEAAQREESGMARINGLLAQLEHRPIPVRDMFYNERPARRRAWNAVRRFYTAALARNAPMAANALAEARRRGADRVVLITGGFHTPGVTRLLRDAGVSHLVVTPQFNPAATLRRLSTLQDAPQVAASIFPPLSGWMSHLTPEERRALASAQWPLTVRRGGRTYKLGHAQTSRRRIPLLAEIDADGLTISLAAGEDNVAKNLPTLSTPPDTRAARRERAMVDKMWPGFAQRHGGALESFLGRAEEPAANVAAPGRRAPLRRLQAFPVENRAFSLGAFVRERPWIPAFAGAAVIGLLWALGIRHLEILGTGTVAMVVPLFSSKKPAVKEFLDLMRRARDEFKKGQDLQRRDGGREDSTLLRQAAAHLAASRSNAARAAEVIRRLLDEAGPLEAARVFWALDQQDAEKDIRGVSVSKRLFAQNAPPEVTGRLLSGYEQALLEQAPEHLHIRARIDMMETERKGLLALLPEEPADTGDETAALEDGVGRSEETARADAEPAAPESGADRPLTDLERHQIMAPLISLLPQWEEEQMTWNTVLLDGQLPQEARDAVTQYKKIWLDDRLSEQMGPAGELDALIRRINDDKEMTITQAVQSAGKFLKAEINRLNRRDRSFRAPAGLLYDVDNELMSANALIREVFYQEADIFKELLGDKMGAMWAAYQSSKDLGLLVNHGLYVDPQVTEQWVRAKKVRGPLEGRVYQMSRQLDTTGVRSFLQDVTPEAGEKKDEQKDAYLGPVLNNANPHGKVSLLIPNGESRKAIIRSVARKARDEGGRCLYLNLKELSMDPDEALQEIKVVVNHLRATRSLTTVVTDFTDLSGAFPDAPLKFLSEMLTHWRVDGISAPPPRLVALTDAQTHQDLTSLAAYKDFSFQAVPIGPALELSQLRDRARFMFKRFESEDPSDKELDALLTRLLDNVRHAEGEAARHPVLWATRIFDAAVVEAMGAERQDIGREGGVLAWAAWGATLRTVLDRNTRELLPKPDSLPLAERAAALVRRAEPTIPGMTRDVRDRAAEDLAQYQAAESAAQREDRSRALEKLLTQYGAFAGSKIDPAWPLERKIETLLDVATPAVDDIPDAAFDILKERLKKYLSKENPGDRPKLGEYLERALRTYGKGRPKPIIPDIEKLGGDRKKIDQAARHHKNDFRKSLNSSHYGMPMVKKILQEVYNFLIYQQLGLKPAEDPDKVDTAKPRRSKKPTVIVLLGPAGVGKTTIAQRFATSLGRPFMFTSFAGTEDVQEVTGFDFTYASARGGRFQQGLETIDGPPVVLIDEGEKASGGAKDAAAKISQGFLPESYMGGLDTSEWIVFYACNYREDIPPEILDTATVIQVSGYAEEDREKMFEDYIVPPLQGKTGRFSKEKIDFDPEKFPEIRRRVPRHTNEMGARQLTAAAMSLFSAAAWRRLLRPKPSKELIQLHHLPQALGEPRPKPSIRNTPRVGEAPSVLKTKDGSAGLLQLQADLRRSGGQIPLEAVVTDISEEHHTKMSASIKIAQDVNRDRIKRLGTPLKNYLGQTIEFGIPMAGSVIDDESLGGAAFLVANSVARGLPIRNDVAVMTDVDSRGRVLPIDLKHKNTPSFLPSRLLGARAAGVRTAILSARNLEHLTDALTDPALQGVVEMDGLQTLLLPHAALTPEDEPDERETKEASRRNEAALRLWKEAAGAPGVQRFPAKESDIPAQGIRIQGKPQAMQAWLARADKDRRLMTYVLVDHVDQISEAALQRPVEASFEDIARQITGASSQTNWEDQDLLAESLRRARLSGVKTFSLPDDRRGDFEAILSEQPALRGLTVLEGPTTWTLRVPRKLPKEDPQMSMPAGESQRWRDYVTDIARLSGTALSTDNEWIVLTLSPEEARKWLEAAPVITESTLYRIVPAANTEERSGTTNIRPQAPASVRSIAGKAAAFALTSVLVFAFWIAPTAAFLLPATAAAAVPGTLIMGGHLSVTPLLGVIGSVFLYRALRRNGFLLDGREVDLPMPESQEEGPADLARWLDMPAYDAVIPIVQLLMSVSTGAAAELENGRPEALSSEDKERIAAAQTLFMAAHNKSRLRAGEMIKELLVVAEWEQWLRHMLLSFDPALIGVLLRDGRRSFMEDRIAEGRMTADAETQRRQEGVREYEEAFAQLKTASRLDDEKEGVLEKMIVLGANLRVRDLLEDPKVALPDEPGKALEQAAFLLRERIKGLDKDRDATAISILNAEIQMTLLILRRWISLKKEDPQPLMQALNAQHSSLLRFARAPNRDVSDFRAPDMAMDAKTATQRTESMLDYDDDNALAIIDQMLVGYPFHEERMNRIRNAYRGETRLEQFLQKGMVRDLSATADQPLLFTPAAADSPLKTLFSPVCEEIRNGLQTLSAPTHVIIAPSLNVKMLAPQAVGEFLLNGGQTIAEEVLSVDFRQINGGFWEKRTALINIIRAVRDASPADPGAGGKLLFIDLDDLMDTFKTEQERESVLKLVLAAKEQTSLRLAFLASRDAHLYLYERMESYRKQVRPLTLASPGGKSLLALELAALETLRLEGARQPLSLDDGARAEMSALANDLDQDPTMLLQTLQGATQNVRNRDGRQVLADDIQASHRDAKMKRQSPEYLNLAYGMRIEKISSQTERTKAELLLAQLRGLSPGPEYDTVKTTLDRLVDYNTLERSPGLLEDLSDLTSMPDDAWEEKLHDLQHKKAIECEQIMAEELLEQEHLKQALRDTLGMLIDQEATLQRMVRQIKRLRKAGTPDPALEERFKEVQTSFRRINLIRFFLGPDGTGKLLAARILARLLKWEIVEIDIGAETDPKAILGHEATWANSQPGKITRAQIAKGRKNIVVVLKGIDKIKPDNTGKNPVAAALLPVLDAVTNHMFNDRNLGAADYSEILWIALAETEGDIEAALRNRLRNPYESHGFDRQQKLLIARKRILPEISGGSGFRIKISDEMLLQIIDNYTRERGVDQLYARLDRLKRILSTEIDDPSKPVTVEQRHLAEFGAPGTEGTLSSDWTPGEALAAFVREGAGELYPAQTSISDLPEGRGFQLNMYGDMDADMAESIQKVAGQAVENVHRLKLPMDVVTDKRMTVTLPVQRTGKDGKSAGMAIFMSVLSALAAEARLPVAYVRKDVVFTGTLETTGRFGLIGGLEEKIEAAQQAQASTVALPYENRADLERALKKNIRFQGFLIWPSRNNGLEGSLSWTKSLFIPMKLAGPVDTATMASKTSHWNEQTIPLLETLAKKAGLTVEKDPVAGITVSGSREEIDAFMQLKAELAKDAPALSVQEHLTQADVLPHQPMTYILLHHRDDIMDSVQNPKDWAQFFYAPQTQVPPSLTASFIFGAAGAAAAVETALAGAAWLAGLFAAGAGLMFAGRLWYARLASRWTALTGEGQRDAAVRDIGGIEPLRRAYPGGIKIAAGAPAAGFWAFLLAPLASLHPLGEIGVDEDGKQTLILQPGAAWALSSANRWDVISRAAALNLLLHELTPHGENEAKGKWAEFGALQGLAPLVSPTPWPLRPVLHGLRRIIAMANLPQIAWHALGRLPGVHQPAAAVEPVLKPRPWALLFRALSPMDETALSSRHVVTFRAAKLSDAAFVEELQRRAGQNPGEPLACVFNESALDMPAMRRAIDAALPPALAGRVIPVGRDEAVETDGISIERVATTLGRSLGNVRLHILEDSSHAGLWIGEVLKILLTPETQDLELSGTAAEEMIRRIHGDSPEGARLLAELRLRGKITLPAKHLPQLNTLDTHRIYATQA